MTLNRDLGEKLNEIFESQKLSLFSERSDCTAALEDAQEMLRLHTKSEVTIALMIYHNTLLNQIQQTITKACK